MAYLEAFIALNIYESSSLFRHNVFILSDCFPVIMYCMSNVLYMGAKHCVIYQQENLVGTSIIHIVGLPTVGSTVVVMLLLIQWLFVL